MKGIYNTKNLVLALSLCFAASAQSQVGINTDNPQAMLDVNGTAIIGNTLTSNGKLILNSVDTAPANGDGVAQLAMDNSGEVYVVRSSTGNTKPFNYIKYTINCATPSSSSESRNRVLANDVDTKIPVDDYTVFIVGSQFSTTDPGNVGLKLAPTNPSSQNNGTFGPMTVIAFKEDGTWRLKADYATSTTADTKSGKWEIYCLIINNAVVRQLDNPAEVTLDTQGGAADSMPAGL